MLLTRQTILIFLLQLNQSKKSSYTETRYRQTTDRDRAWFTQLTSSGEGWMTYTRFWLEKSNGENVSKACNVQAGGLNLSIRLIHQRVNRE
ncbi:DUF2712 domain-containing protein [Enterococcus plantarum]|nr:DUF2712 domain-containing protein [Enterococcus plantarum]